MNKKLILVFLVPLITHFLIMATVVMAEDEIINTKYFVDVDGVGTYFEIKDSEYLNITLSSIETVHVFLESVPKMVSFIIESECSSPLTDLILGGFKPNSIYYRYQDGNFIESFTTNSEGKYGYTQDISKMHLIYILEEKLNNLYITADYTFTDDIFEPIVVAADNITIDGNGFTLRGPGFGYALLFHYRNNVTIQNIVIKNWRKGIHMIGSTHCTINENTITSNSGSGMWVGSYGTNTITNNTITSNTEGLRISFSSDNIISENTITSNFQFGIFGKGAINNTISSNTITSNALEGIMLWYSSGNMMSKNTIASNGKGIYLYDSSGCTMNENTLSDNSYGLVLSRSNNNIIYHNNVIDNIIRQVYSYESVNTWDDGYPSGGNYWSDYVGNDEYSGANQDQTGKDGIWDVPYVIDANNRDRYAFVNQDCWLIKTIESDDRVVRLESRLPDVYIIRDPPGAELARKYAVLQGKSVLEPYGIYDIGPTGTTFEPPAIITFYYPDNPAEGGYRLHRFVNTTWEKLPNQDINTTENYITAPITSVSFFAILIPIPLIPATVDLNPDTLNLKSQGKFVTLYIEFPEGFDVRDIDVSTVKISKIDEEEITPIFAEARPIEIGDYDEDRIPDLMVKFDRGSLQELLSPAVEVEITVEGNLKDDGIPFKGADTIRVVEPGRAVISSAGGKIISPYGADIEIPAGALKKETLIRVSKENRRYRKRENALKRKNYKICESGFNFEPDGLRFKKPVKIGLPYNLENVVDEVNLKIGYWNKKKGEWEIVENSYANIREKKVFGEINHFSSYAVIEWETDGVAISSGSEDQHSPEIIPDGEGGAYIVWKDSYGVVYAPMVFDLYLTRINSSGEKHWTICVAPNVPQAEGDSCRPLYHIASDEAGGVFVAWEDDPDDGFGTDTLEDVHLARVNPSGNILWSSKVSTANGCQGLQMIKPMIPDGSGGVIVVLHDFRNSPFADLYAQKINADGEIQWQGDVPIVTANSFQQVAYCVSDGVGGAIIAWEDNRSGNLDIYTQRINSSGQVQWATNGVPLCTASDTQRDPVVVSDGQEGAIILWSDRRDGSNYFTYGQRVGSNGVTQWTDNGLQMITTITGGPYRAISDGSGGAIFSVSNGDIYAQRIDNDGSKVWASSGAAICTASGIQNFARMTSDGLGGAIITWQDNRGSDTDIYAQKVDKNGKVKWANNGETICTASGNQSLYGIYGCTDPSLASDDAGGAIIVWTDKRSGDMDVYAQRIRDAGPHHFKITGLPNLTAIDTSLNLSVEIQNTLTQKVTDYAGNICFESDDLYAVLPGTYTFTTSDKGIKEFPNSVKFKTSGLRHIKVYDTTDTYLVGYATITVKGISPIKCEIKVPQDGKRISGNRITVMAEIIEGDIFYVKEALLQYKEANSDSWQDIPAAGMNHPNPDKTYPYFIHWDVSGLSEGKYDIRAVISDKDNNLTSSQEITVTVDHTDFDSEEKVAGTTIQKRQKVNNTIESVVVLGSGEDDAFVQVSIPSEAVDEESTFLKVELNPSTKPQPDHFDSTGQYSNVELESGEECLSNNKKATITFSYPDTDDNGVVDGTSIKEKNLGIFSYNKTYNIWERNLSSEVDRDKNICSIEVGHFSLFGLFSASARNLDDILVYPNPYVPFDGDDDNGKPYTSGDLKSGIIFENVTKSLEIKVYTVSGELVWDKYVDSTSGRIQWDAKNNNGRDVSSGVYFAVFTAPNGQRKVSKIGIVR